MASAPSSDRFSSDHFFSDQSLRSQCLPNCASLSFGFVVDKLAKHCHCFGHLFECGQRIFEVSATELSPTNGFTSRVFRCEFEFGAFVAEKQMPKKRTMSAIAKVISLERMDTLAENFVGKEQMEKMRNSREQTEMIESTLLQLHRNECNLYKFIGSSAPLPLPKVFYTQTAEEGEGVGLILMEDLSQSTHLEPFENGLTIKKTETVARHLAHFHAKMNTKNDWQQNFLDANELFEGQQKDSGGMSEWGSIIHKQMMQFDKEKLEAPLKRMRRLFISMDFGKWAQRKCRELGMEETLLHNDLWINNILWHNGQRADEVAAFIDWQLASRGNPMIDVARLVLMNTSPEVRKELEKDGRLLKQYLEVHRTEGGQNQFELDKLTKAYKLAMVGQTVGFVMVLPFFQRVWAEETNCEVKNAKLMERAVAALADAVEVLEEEAPEWLEDAAEEPGNLAENPGI
ncbi:hypothetical protein niasHS_017613 [Heterodera schachtii]|uniref:CHK kinase-like domain-containing protein n=1 Tax=Heterodera schachtii TaxID=97005 RepID=A0ABD2HY17_HETSC